MLEKQAIETIYGEGVLSDRSYSRDSSEARMIVLYDWVRIQKRELIDIPADWDITYGSAYYSIGKAIHRMRRDPRFRDSYAEYVEAKMGIVSPSIVRPKTRRVADSSVA